MTVTTATRRREVHRPGHRAELARQRDGQERTAADVRSLHETADGDAGSTGAPLEQERTEVQGHGQRTGRRHGARLQGQRSERHRSGQIDGHGRGQRRMVGLARRRRCPTEPTRRSHPSRARSATKKARANRGPSKSSPSRRRSKSLGAQRTVEGDRRRTFEGKASEAEPVTVHIHEGSGPGGPVVETSDGDRSANTNGT